jgi:branched-chain amino acid transport system substrate-binding protein
MKTTQKSWLIASLVTVAVITIVLIIVNRQSGKPQQMQVGAIIPLTGDVATYGDSLKKGFDLAAEETGGQIQVVYEDSKANPSEGVSAMQMLLNQGVNHFLGDATSGVCLAIAPLANRNQAILMISIATSDDLSNAGPYVFRNCPPNQKQADAAADFVKNELKVSNVAILAKASAYAANLAAKFRDGAESRGLKIVLDEQYDASLSDFGTLVEKLRSAAPDVVFVPGNYEETALILRKARELGLTLPFIGTDGAYSPKLIELAGPAAEGFYITMLGIDTSSSFYQEFKAKYRNYYNGEPDVFSAYGYEGASVLFQAMVKGGSISDQRDRLASSHFPGLLGDVSFDKRGQVVRPVGIMQVRQGRFIPYANNSPR